MIYWAQLLHFYQPPIQMPVVLRKICEESYRPLIKVFQEHPYAKATVNINGVLTEMLSDQGHGDIIEGLKELAARGQIEFTGTAKYHAILPLIPEAEVYRQITQNRRTNSYFLGKWYRPKGFFPPEMCYSAEIIPSVVKTEHQWLILSGIACPVEWPLDVIHKVVWNGSALRVLFRDDILSNKISFQNLSPQDFIASLEQLQENRENIYVVTAMDAETYGHHIQNWEKLFLAAVYDELEPRKETYNGIKQAKALSVQQAALAESVEAVTQVRTATLSELIDIFSEGEIIEPKPSSWSTTAEDMAAGNPYPLWLDKGNEIHRLQWEHLYLCMEMVNQAFKCADNDESKFFAGISRGLLDSAEHSCQFWWASRRPMWDINLVHLGLINQWRVVVNAYRAINTSGSPGEVKREYYHKVVAARDLRDKIVDRLFIL